MLLGIDTCGASGTIALVRWSDGAVSHLVQAELAGKTFAAQLVPKIQDLLASQGSNLEDLKAIVVVNGPGSFTGLRIGVSSSKALAEALSLPLLAVSRLAVLAQKAQADMAVLDGGRDEYYFRKQKQESLFTPEEVRRRLNGTLAVCEENVAHAFPAALLVDPPTAADALVYAVPRLQAKDFDDIAMLDGNYVRRSDAELFAKPGARADQTTTVKA
jgi:tRNA threonylcarbamoyladenosine biosynthesis protein TsaB